MKTTLHKSACPTIRFQLDGWLSERHEFLSERHMEYACYFGANE
jgi:hypothetical protein